MTRLIDFESLRLLAKTRRTPPEKPGEIVFFTGVRYMREQQADLAPTEKAAHLPDHQPRGKNERNRA